MYLRAQLADLDHRFIVGCGIWELELGEKVRDVLRAMSTSRKGN